MAGEDSSRPRSPGRSGNIGSIPSRGPQADSSRPRLCENSRVQFARRKFFSIWSICKPKLLTTAIEEGKRETGSTLSWRAHVFTRPGPIADIGIGFVQLL